MYFDKNLLYIVGLTRRDSALQRREQKDLLGNTIDTYYCWRRAKQAFPHTLNELQNESKLLPERLGRLVTLPDEQLWNEWQK